MEHVFAQRRHSTATDAPELTLTPEDHRRLGIDLFNFVWTLLERANRSQDDIDRMIHAAHASRQARARSARVAGDDLARALWLTKAREAAKGIEEAEEGDLLLSDLATV